MSYRLLTGDVRAMLATLEVGSVSLCITSPPYWGLRSYSSEPQVFDEPAGGCAHEWQPFTRPGQSGGTASAKVQIKGQENFQIVPDQQQATCARSGCWLGELGSEPDVSSFIRHLGDIFDGVWRVLHPTGVLVVNLGDSMSGSGKGPAVGNGIGDQEQRQGFTGSRGARMGSVHGDSGHTSGVTPPPGMKAKNMMLVPSRFALEMQRRGWWVRSWMPWVKFGSAMPESCQDRPSNALEWLILLSKSSAYYWDPTAVRVSGREHSGNAGTFARHASRRGEVLVPGNTATHREDRDDRVAAGRNYRNSDPLLTVLDAEIEASHARLQALHKLRTAGGLWGDADGEPLALLANPHASGLLHFATFPEALVRPFVAAGSSERGVCGVAGCYAPWERETEPSPDYRERLERGRRHDAWGGERPSLASTIGNAFGAKPESGTAEYVTLGWRPTCAHGGEPVPALVLDIFSGTGTTGVVATAMGRDYVGIELSPEYVALAEARLGSSQATLF